MLDWDQNSTSGQDSLVEQPVHNKQARGYSASSKRKFNEDETIQALQVLTQLKNSAAFQSTLGRAKFVAMAFESSIYQQIRTKRIPQGFDISHRDIEGSLSGVDRDVVIHLVVSEALQKPKLRASILSSDTNRWDAWCDTFDAVERARAVDRYKGMRHMCSRFADLYSDACEKMRTCFNPRWELASAEHYLTPIEYRELVCLSSLLIIDDAPFGPVELGRRAFAGNIENPGMDTDLIAWIKTFSKNSSPRNAIDKWKAGWNLAMKLEQLAQAESCGFVPTT